MFDAPEYAVVACSDAGDVLLIGVLIKRPSRKQKKI